MPTNLRDLPVERGGGAVLPFVEGLDLPGPSGSSAATGQFGTTGMVAGVLVLLLLLASLIVAIVHARRARRRIGVGTVAEPVEGVVDVTMRVRLRQAVEHARADLAARAGGPADDAVIAAWLRLENATGPGRLPHQTASEFTAALLARHTMNEPALDELRELYQRARFSTSRDGDAATAAAALEQLLDALEPSVR